MVTWDERVGSGAAASWLSRDAMVLNTELLPQSRRHQQCRRAGRREQARPSLQAKRDQTGKVRKGGACLVLAWSCLGAAAASTPTATHSYHEGGMQSARLPTPTTRWKMGYAVLAKAIRACSMLVHTSAVQYVLPWSVSPESGQATFTS